MSEETEKITAEEALERLKKGNEWFLATGEAGDFSPEIREQTRLYGQHPYAIILTCSDSRVVPESIFGAGIGDLFVIRVAGNVINDFQMGSIEYAAEHLGSPLVVVMGHTNCGAVGAAITEPPMAGFVKTITDEILKAVGDEKDDYAACCLNVRYSLDKVRKNLEGLRAVGAVYHLEDGRVEFLDD